MSSHSGLLLLRDGDFGGIIGLSFALVGVGLFFGDCGGVGSGPSTRDWRE